MGYVCRHDHALLDFRLSLPEEWARDEPRRQACHVPPEVRYHTRQEQGVEMLDAWGNQVPHGWVTGDDELGRHAQFAAHCASVASAMCWACPAPRRFATWRRRCPRIQGGPCPRPCTIKEESRSSRIGLDLGDPLARSAPQGLHLECRHGTCTRASETVGYLW